MAGVVLSPVAGLEYATTISDRDTCNGEPIEVRRPPALEHALIGTALGYETEVRERGAQAVARISGPRIDLKHGNGTGLPLYRPTILRCGPAA